MKYSKITLATILAIGSGQLQAEMQVEEDFMLLYEDEEMISIATGTQKPIHLAPSVAHVITASDIQANGATKLDQVLDMVPGIHVSLSTVNRLNYVYSIRGIHTGQNPQTLILMNGLPFRSAYSGARPNGFHYPVENIERIEVIRGPGSAVYGADAFAGVINIITKDADSMAGFSAGGRSGSFGSQSVWLQSGNTLNDWDIAFSLEYMDSDGDDERIINSDAQSALDGKFATTASLAPDALVTRYALRGSQYSA